MDAATCGGAFALALTLWRHPLLRRDSKLGCL
jgi:hypothetical protein